MAEGAAKTGAKPPAKAFYRPLSPHILIWRWTPTMAASIVHRGSGLALAAGTLFLAWWLIAAASGPNAYADFVAAAVHPLGRLVLFGFTWALAFHLLNGLRHLAWDVGYGFKVPTAKLTAILAFAVSFVLAVLVFALAYNQAGTL